jgi:hydroxymethylglutaryl-CoA lyase
MGYDTGIDLDRLIDTAKCVEEIIGRSLPGQVMKAGKWDRRYPLPARLSERLVARS